MKKLIFVCFVTVIVGCQKQPEKIIESTDKSFEDADAKLSSYLDILDSKNAKKKDQKTILCEEYPQVYEHEYMPNLLKLSNTDSKEKLLNDLRVTTEYYSQKLDIICE